MSLPIINKKAAEKRTVTFDFTSSMIDGDTLSTGVISADTGLTYTSGSLSGDYVSTQISSGETGKKYTLSCTGTTAQGDIIIISATVVIREDTNT